VCGACREQLSAGPDASVRRRFRLESGLEESLARTQRDSFGMSVFISGGGSMGSRNLFSANPGSLVKSGYCIAKVATSS
jgi:hypothetical protein